MAKNLVDGDSVKIYETGSNIYLETAESGSNENGSWIKYEDGTMICYKIENFGSVDFNDSWGALYETAGLSLGNFPVPFVGEYPVVTLMPTRSWFLDRGYSKSLTSWGTFWAARPVTGAQEVEVYCIAIGRWK